MLNADMLFSLLTFLNNFTMEVRLTQLTVFKKLFLSVMFKRDRRSDPSYIVFWLIKLHGGLSSWGTNSDIKTKGASLERFAPFSVIPYHFICLRRMKGDYDRLYIRSD